MLDARGFAAALARRIRGLRDPALRVRYLEGVIHRLDPGRLADVLTVTMHGAEARDGDLGALLLGLCLALAQDGMEELRGRTAREAAARGQADTALLLRHRPAERESHEPLAVPDFGKGRQLTLGERKSLARRRDRDLLARVLRDPHPDVIRILLGNPALTEADVIRLCAQRPVAPEVLREVFRHPRWIVRYAVRRAIVRNPFSPLDLALQLAAHLNAQDARQVVESPELAVPLRQACERVAGLATLH